MGQRGVIYGFIGTKGGTGKTTLAVNVAAILAKNKGKRVVLLDFNFSGGSDLANLLNLTPKPNILEVLESLPKLTPASLEKYLILHRLGLHLLVGPHQPLDTNTPNCGQVEKILHLLTYNYDLILVDCGQSWEERQIAALNLAQEVILIGEADVLSLKSLMLQIERIHNTRIPLARVKLVINKITGAAGLTPKQIAAMVPMPISAFFPADYELTLGAMVSGIPFVTTNPNAALSRALAKFAGALGQQKLKLPATPAPETMLNWQALKNQVHQRVLAEIKPLELSGEVCEPGQPSLRQRVERQVLRFLDEVGSDFSKERRLTFLGEIMDDILGLGPLEVLLRDDSVSEILINGLDHVYIERAGKLEKTELAFKDQAEIYRIIERIVTPLGRRIDESMPMVDARLPDGSRVNAVIAPVALRGPYLSIRKFRRVEMRIQDFLEQGTCTEEIAQFLAGCVQSKKNILVSGGTSSGKTTTLNILSSFIPPDQRIITIEDAAELKLQQEHVVALEARPANIEGKGEITIRQLVRNALRMRPDRLVVGEVRGEEVWDMLQAMNTGHTGSLSTCHANSPQDLLNRLEGMVLMAGFNLPLRAIRAQIASALDLLVHQERLRDGQRKITRIVELEGIKDGEFQFRELFTYCDGVFKAQEKPSFNVPIVPLPLEKGQTKAYLLPKERGQQQCVLH